MKMKTSIVLMGVAIVLLFVVVSVYAKDQGQRRQRPQHQTQQQQPQEGQRKRKMAKRSGYFDDIPYPLAVLANPVVGDTNSCFPGMPYIGVATGNDSTPIAPVFPLPISLEFSSIRTVDNVHDAIYIPVNPLEAGPLLAISLSIFSGYSVGPFSASGEIVFLDPNFETLEIGDGILAMEYNSNNGLIYVIWKNESYAFVKGKYETVLSYGISTYNVAYRNGSYIASTPLLFTVDNYGVTSTVSAFDIVSNVIWFKVNRDRGGNVYGFNVHKQEIVATGAYKDSDPLFNCLDWSYDGFSGNIFSSCQSGSSIYLGIFDPKTLSITNVGTLTNGPANVVPGTLEIDDLLGPGYTIWSNGYQYFTAKFNPDTALVEAITTFNATTMPYWAAFGNWLDDGYYY